MKRKNQKVKIEKSIEHVCVRVLHVVHTSMQKQRKSTTVGMMLHRRIHSGGSKVGIHTFRATLFNLHSYEEL